MLVGAYKLHRFLFGFLDISYIKGLLDTGIRWSTNWATRLEPAWI